MKKKPPPVQLLVELTPAQYTELTALARRDGRTLYYADGRVREVVQEVAAAMGVSLNLAQRHRSTPEPLIIVCNPERMAPSDEVPNRLSHKSAKAAGCEAFDIKRLRAAGVSR
jgi:quinolinate synthase